MLGLIIFNYYGIIQLWKRLRRCRYMTLRPKVRLIDVLIKAAARIMITDMVLMAIDLSVVVVYRVAESGLIGEICGAEVDIGLMESRLNLI